MWLVHVVVLGASLIMVPSPSGIGGVLSPVLLAAQWWAARATQSRILTAVYVVVAGLTAATGMWVLTYVTLGGLRGPWIWLLPLLAGVGAVAIYAPTVGLLPRIKSQRFAGG